MSGKELAELCKGCENINECSPRGYVCPALQKLWRLFENTGEVKGCQTCRRATDLLLASYELKDPELSNAILRFLVKHAATAGHKESEGWVLGRRGRP